MSTVSNKTKAFISLDSDFFNHSSTKRMEVAMEIELSDLQINIQQHPINFHDYYKEFSESAKSFSPFSKKSLRLLEKVYTGKQESPTLCLSLMAQLE